MPRLITCSWDAGIKMTLTLAHKSDDPDSQNEATWRFKTLIQPRAGSPAVIVLLATSQN
ncbi:hypothetical protein PSAB6_50086 [Paraburkholderia sabiae]|nr:hypothetical protein PSAB6_50086 [Paraburkholderia sabiae]